MERSGHKEYIVHILYVHMMYIRYEMLNYTAATKLGGYT